MIDDSIIAGKRSCRMQLRLSTRELETLRIKSKSKGFSNASQLLRYMTLQYDIVIETKILETNKLVREILEILKEKENHPK